MLTYKEFGVVSAPDHDFIDDGQHIQWVDKPNGATMAIHYCVFEDGRIAKRNDDEDILNVQGAADGGLL